MSVHWKNHVLLGIFVWCTTSILELLLYTMYNTLLLWSLKEEGVSYLQARSYLDQMGKVMDESRKHSSSLEGLKAKAFETEKDLLSTKAALEAAHKGIEDRGHKLAGAQAELDKER